MCEQIKEVEKMRHSLSHVLAAAVQELYSTTTFGIGPAIDNGFYYDIDFGGDKVSDADLAKIEKKMRGIIARGAKMVKREATRDEALNWAKENGQRLKTELIAELPDGETITFYDMVAPDGTVIFTDLCKGPHVKDLKEIGALRTSSSTAVGGSEKDASDLFAHASPAFNLSRVAGAYWRGDEKREMLTRIYGVAFETEAELEEYLKRQEEAKARDHRKLGRELELYCFSDLVGAGLPMFTERGTIVRDMLANYSLSLRQKAGFGRVWTPHITKMDLYKTSGHYAKFGDELFLVKSQVNGEEFALKPMNCPHHTQIFASKPRTYKEMPVRMMEPTTDYRDEKSGELGGLSRVRSLTQDDSHVFCRKEQIKDEIKNLVQIVKELYATMGMSKLRARLSYRNDEDKYLGDKALWEMAQEKIKEAAIENGLDFFEMEGEAAFYGPKIDFMAEDAIGREHQVATIQLDFVQPERFGLEFVNEKGEKEMPVMIHHATLGSIERFMSVFIEHTAGWFPLWCAPEMVRVITVNDAAVDYAKEVEEVLRGVVLEEPLANNAVRYEVDYGDDSLGKKIKRATELKIPVILIVGPKDAADKVVSVRTRDGEEKVALDKLAEWLKEQ